jgi:hypothetical protein
MLDGAGGVVFLIQLIIVGSELDVGFHSRLEFGYRALTNTLGIDARHVSGCDNGRCDYDTRKDMQDGDNKNKTWSGLNKDRQMTAESS